MSKRYILTHVEEMGIYVIPNDHLSDLMTLQETVEAVPRLTNAWYSAVAHLETFLAHHAHRIEGGDLTFEVPMYEGRHL